METARLSLLFIYISIAVFGYLLEYLNVRRLKGRRAPLPPELEEAATVDQLAMADGYTVENSKFGVVSSLCHNTVFLVFLLLGLGPYNGWIGSFGLGFVPSGVLFFVILSLGAVVFEVPFRLYHTFVIEKRYGFNTMTGGLWAADLLKSTALSIALTAVAAGAAFWIFETSPGLWWLWLWIFYLGLSVLLMYIAPYLIEPLFNKFEPLGDTALEESIRGLVDRAGIKVSRVFRMDASKRTSHTNAYFTGIGRVKRIVLYDTLLEKFAVPEILAVLAHEIGHWKRRHLLKGIILSEALALVSLYVSHLLLRGGFLNGLMGVAGGSFFTGVFILGFLGSIVSFPAEALLNLISRRHEREADRFSRELTGDSSAMISSLVKLSAGNLSNLRPHPLYVAFHYSHPPVVERIESLKRL